MRVDLPGRGLHLEAESHGKPSDPPVILIMGLGLQLIFWPEELIEALTDAGFRVIVFDNRDCGLSGSRFERAYTAPGRALLAHMFRRPFRPAYRLPDMAEDTLALADALQIESFHLVGVSLGGMVAQTLAARYPDRVLSLVSIMSNAGPDTAPWPKPGVLRKFMRRPPRRARRQARIEHTVRVLVAVGRLRDDAEIDRLRERVAAAVDRAWRPDGIARQLLAVLADRDRSAEVHMPDADHARRGRPADPAAGRLLPAQADSACRTGNRRGHGALLSASLSAANLGRAGPAPGRIA